MFDHVTIRVSDRAVSEQFYAQVLDVLGHAKTNFDEWDDFSLAQGDAPTRRLHIGFRAASRELVDAFWRTGVEAGYRDDGPPGPRPRYTADYYGSFLLDPDGNSAEAVHYEGMRRDGTIDHLWIRVADLGAAKRFYETIAPLAGFSLRADRPSRANFGTGNGSFAVVATARRRRTSTSHFRQQPMPPSTRSTAPQSRRAIWTTALRASARCTTEAITRPSSSIPTATTSRS